jgi:uncharacterized Tic20 family protein
MTAPGWYPDPNGQPYQRWWDGTQWTEQTAAQAQAQAQAQTGYAQQTPPGYAQQVPPGYAQPGQALQPYGMSRMTPEQARSWAMWAHLSGLLGLLGPLIIYLVKKDDDPFVADQSREALNFHIALLIVLGGGWIAAVVLSLILIGFLLFPFLIAAGIAAFVFEIIAGVQASKGVWYRYPANIRFIKA